MFNLKKIKELEQCIDTLFTSLHRINEDINGVSLEDMISLCPRELYPKGLKEDVEELKKSVRLIEKYLSIHKETTKAKPEETKYVENK